ncbi:MAG: hypothetical protein K8R59_01475 [Thermoanaerobaculales bacterium]|nr:hypothetical protein [Thermoanaerobaculales bacterium]
MIETITGITFFAVIALLFVFASRRDRQSEADRSDLILIYRESAMADPDEILKMSQTAQDLARDILR